MYHLFQVPLNWSKPKLMDSWSTYEDFLTSALPKGSLIVLASGQGGKLLEVVSRLMQHQGVFLFAMNTPFHRSKPKDTRRFWYRMSNVVSSFGVMNSTVVHSDFGGATSAAHQIFYKNIKPQAFHPPAGVPRVLKHLVNSASPGRFAVIETPTPLQGDFPWAPVVVNGLLRLDGLLEVFHRDRFLACPSVFSKTK